LETKGNVVYYDNSTKAISYGSTPVGIEPRPLNNTWTGYNNFTNDVSLNGITRINGNIISSGTNIWNGINQFTNDVSLNGTTQINGTLKMYGLNNTNTNINTNTNSNIMIYDQCLNTISYRNDIFLISKFNNTTYSLNQKLITTSTDLCGGIQMLQYGFSTALSSDGSVFAIGGSQDNTISGGGIGAVWIYENNYGNIIKKQKLIANDICGNYVGQGHSVSLSNDGKTLAVGGPYDNNVYSNNSIGATWIWKYNNITGLWEKKQKLVANNYSQYPKQGWSVALSGDGNTLGVGGPGDNNSTGATWVWNYNNITGLWENNQKLVSSSKLDQGSSVSISNDGKTIVDVGRYYSGVATIWILNNLNTWVSQTTLEFTSIYYSSSLSSDGNILALASEINTVIYTRNGVTWSLPYYTNEQSRSVSLTSTGNKLAIGNRSTNTTKILVNNNSTWSVFQQFNDSNDIQKGYFVSFSDDGTTLLDSALWDNNYKGSVSIYQNIPLTTYSIGSGQSCNVGIGTSTPSYTLDVNGNASISGTANILTNVAIGKSTTPNYELDVSGTIFASADVFAMSDIRSKKDIVQISDALDKVKQMRGCYFTMRDTNKRSIGLIAQEAQKIIPEVVSITESEDKYLGISYGNIVGLLVEAIKDSDIEMNQLKMQNVSLIEKVDSLTTDVSTLKSQVQLLLSKLTI